jgi:hypothetical protein
MPHLSNRAAVDISGYSAPNRYLLPNAGSTSIQGRLSPASAEEVPKRISYRLRRLDQCLWFVQSR